MIILIKTSNLLTPIHRNFFVGFLDAKSCYFIKTIINWGRDWNDFKTNTSLYKTKISSVYCSYDEVCCGKSCCPDPSVTPKYYYYDTYNYQYDSSDDDSKMYVHL